MRRAGSGSDDRGLSLIELVIAMAVFALVAVMGLQSLSGTMRVSDRLTQIDEETAELGNAIALLRNDLTAVVPMLFYAPQNTPRPAVDLSQDKTVLALSVAGQTSLTPSHTNRHRAEWSVDTAKSTLSRRFWPALIPSDQSQQSPNMIVMSGVRALTVRTFWPSVGWVAGTTPPLGAQTTAPPEANDQDVVAAASSVHFSNMPIAVEIMLETTWHGDLRFVQALK